MITDDLLALAVQFPDALRWLDATADAFVEKGSMPMDLRRRQSNEVAPLLEAGFLAASTKGDVRMTRRGLRALIEAHQRGLLGPKV